MVVSEIMAYLESIRWKGGVNSPFYPQGKVYSHPKPYTYLCKEANKQFTVLSGTWLANHFRYIHKWKKLVDMLGEGINELDIISEVQVSDSMLASMYKIICDCIGLKRPPKDKYLHYDLLKALKGANADEIFGMLLSKKKKPKK